ncbi:MAG: sugar ABC transporter permease [Mycobacterium sp.]|nr:sugar ABC transporter permease [Mycobacterium sp.]
MAELTYAQNLRSGSSTSKKRRKNAELRRLAVGLGFISPWIIGFLAFTFYPMIASFYYSLTTYDAISPPHFVGLANYRHLFLDDSLFRTALYNTMYFVIIGVPVGFVVAFLLASLLNQPMRGRAFFRTVFFLPAITPLVGTAMVWLWIYDPQFGLINSFLAGHGFKAIPWLTSTSVAKPAIIIILTWAQGSTILVFLAALQGVPQHLYEAATIDGANTIRRFWHVTIPMCTPSMLFVLVTSLIASFQSFTLPWLLTQGGPDNSTELYGVYLYRNAFVYFKLGYASAMAWLLFLIICGFSILLMKTSARWVYYAE